MRVLVFGASGRTGRLVVEESLAKGHQVVVFVRSPTKLAVSNPQLSVVSGDAISASEVDDAVQHSGAEAVVSTLGIAPNSPHSVCSVSMANIVASMSRHGVKRLVCLSDYGNGETRDKGMYARVLWHLIRAHLEDKDKMEGTIKSSDLDWTIVRAVILTDGAMTGTYRVGPEIKVGLIPKISRHDLADFIAKQVTDASFLRSSPSISY